MLSSNKSLGYRCVFFFFSHPPALWAGSYLTLKEHQARAKPPRRQPAYVTANAISTTMSLVTKRLSAGSDQRQPIHHRELKRRNPCYLGKSISMATIALADSIFPAGMGASSGIAKHWQDGVCLLGGRKAKKCSRPPFGSKNPQGISNPRVFPRVAAHRAAEGPYLGYLHVLCAHAGCSHPHLPPTEPARVSSWEPCRPGPEEGDTAHHCGSQYERGTRG